MVLILSLLLHLNLLVLFVAGSSSSSSPTTVVPLSSPPLQILGTDGAIGVFDPSILSTGDSAFPYLMSYSSVGATDNIHSSVGVFDVGLNAWVDVGPINAIENDTLLPCGGGASCIGNVIHEVSSLFSHGGYFYAFSHTYIVTNETELHYDWGYLSLYRSNVSNGGELWQETKLLGWDSSSSFSSTGVQQSLSQIPQLNDCLFFTEPGATTDASQLIYLALGCIYIANGTSGSKSQSFNSTEAAIRIVLLTNSGDPEGKGWSYISTLVDGARDAALLGYSIPQLNAADLFWAPPGNSLYLSISPSATIEPYDFVGYVGCLILSVLQDKSGVQRVNGVPVIVRSIVPSSAAFAGACTVASTPSLLSPEAGNYLLPVLRISPEDFTILPSSQSAP